MNVVRVLAAVSVLLVLAGCKTMGGASVPEGEAEAFARKTRTIALATPEQRLGLFALACADLPSCRRNCEKAFRAFGTMSDDDRSEAMLACPDFDGYSKGANVMELRERSKEWILLELRRYALAVDRKLEGRRVLEIFDRAIAGEPPYWE